MTEQQGDVQLYQADDGGGIDVTAGIVAMSGGLETAAYLSLFGGNEQDDGRADNPLQYWGNLSETQLERQYRSETQYLLRSIPAIPANLLRLKDAAKRDLAWLLAVGAATSIDVSVSMPGLNRVLITLTLGIEGDPAQLQFVTNWQADSV